MQDRFDYRTLWAILDRMRRSHRLLRFMDVSAARPDEPFVILRHDVDYSTEAALALAEQEAGRGVQATYFLLLNGAYYNLLDPSHAHVPARLTELGHEVGLHFDVNFLQRFPRARWPALMDMQAGILGELANALVSSVAMHQPGLYGEDPMRNDDHFINAYADRYCREMTYISDSCRAWRDSAWSLLATGTLPHRIQLALHPINWASEDRDRGTIFREIHTALVREITDKERTLFEQVSQHQGVREHESRIRGVTPPEAE